MQHQWISFKIQRETYASPVRDVKEVIPYIEPVPVPGAPTEVEGIVNMRGHLIPVLSGRHLLDLATPEPEAAWRIITLETPQGQLGVSVDKVDGIVEFAPDDIDPGVQTGKEDHLIQGTVQHGDDLLILVDFSTHYDKIANYG